MQTLFFLRFKARSGNRIVFLQTAKNAVEAEAAGWAGINPAYRGDYRLTECTAVCKTREAVNLFEPC